MTKYDSSQCVDKILPLSSLIFDAKWEKSLVGVPHRWHSDIDIIGVTYMCHS